MTAPFPDPAAQFRSLGVLMTRRSTQVALLAGVVAVILAIMLAPNVSATGWDWTRLLLITALGAVGILMFTSARTLAETHQDQSQRLVIAGLLVAIALLLNLTFSFGTTIVFSLGITIITMFVFAGSAARSTWLASAALIALVPFWVWSALHAWTWLLLLLIPLLVIGLISDGHVRATASAPGDRRVLSQRAHWLAGALGVVGSAMMTVVLSILTDAVDGVNILGAIGATAMICLAAGTTRTDDEGSARAVLLVDTALVWLATCWVISL